MSLLESPHSVVAPSEEQHAKKDGRRDTIANFFSSAQSSPNLLSEKGATFSLLAPEMTEDLTVDMELSSPLAIRGHQQDLSGGASKLPSLSPISKAGRRSSMRKRDSIACFFESPKYHTVVSTEEEQPELDEEADADMEIDVLSPGMIGLYLLVDPRV